MGAQLRSKRNQVEMEVLQTTRTWGGVPVEPEFHLSPGKIAFVCDFSCVWRHHDCLVRRESGDRTARRESPSASRFENQLKSYLIYHLITMIKVLPQLQTTNSGETPCHQQLPVGLWSDRAASTEPGACYFSYPQN